MKSSETDILVIPGYEGSGPAHWQSRMVAKLPTAQVVEQHDWLYPSLDKAVEQLTNAVAKSERPIVVVSHSAGNTLLAHALPALQDLGQANRIKGAFMVAAPSARALGELLHLDPAFASIPRGPLSFPSLLVASSNDPFATLEEQADLALAWGSQLVEAGEAGHINTASGHGPWPEGIMRFAGFLSKLKV
jgi:uncharacterized protein